tara:strand:+ start:3050 stop:3955 length:906 start_codon:yes stop_codon:yes gene_type:complete
MKKIKLALDWTPNINHIGFFVAKEKGYFKEKGIDLKIISPDIDNYKETPAKKIELGNADFGLCPTETLISFRTKENKFNLLAVLTIYQKDISAIVVNNNSKIYRPKDLDNKTYASYGARYEDLIIKKLIKNDGGNGNINIHYPKRLGVWETVLKEKFDSTWIFLNWEGIQRTDLNFFKLENYKIPYSYSPLLVTSELFLKNTDRKIISEFIDITKKGYIYSINNIEDSSNILKKYVPKDEKVDIKKSLEFSVPYFGDISKFGVIKPSVLTKFIMWLNKNQIEKLKIDANDLIYNFDEEKKK